MHHLDKVHLLDKVNYFIQTRIDVPPIISNRAETNLGPLPKIIIPDFRDGHIKTVPYPIDQFSEHVSLFFQRMIFWNPKVELANSDHHLLPPFPFRRNPTENQVNRD
jgi:hypothetical protein